MVINMIKVSNLHKYFNRNKPNEIHVINNINLSFPNTGLVCLLGPSGSGKTTLMNVISGLDRVQGGSIQVHEHVITRYHANEWDLIRNRYFGYVFQNYILLPDLTVYQNLEFVLKMFELTKEQIDQRIDYALNAVGMVKYKKRRPTQLSGGQQQRVAIARALVKAPDVIVADEPTGNLDEKNTLQIMNIIKKVSQECLVIMVTHERRLADFFADQIIELKDGQIVSERNVSQDSEFQSLYDTNIYLGELENKQIEAEQLKVDFYADKPTEPLKLSVIFKDNTFYIHTSQDNIKIKFLDKSSETKIIPGKKPIIKLDDVNRFEYELPKIPKSVKEKAAAIKYRDTFKMAIRYLSNLTKRKKLLFVVMFLSAILVVSGITKLYSAVKIDEREFLFENRNLIEIKRIDDFDLDDVTSLQTKIGDALILPNPGYSSINRYSFDVFAQTRNNSGDMPKHSLLPLSLLDNPQMFLGTLPTNPKDIVIDKWLADAIIENYSFKEMGGNFYEQLIGQDYFKNYGESFGKIVGIVNTNNPTIYVSDELFYLNALQTNDSQSMANANFDNITLRNITSYVSIADYLAFLESNQLDEPVSQPILANMQKTKQVFVSFPYFEIFLANETDNNHIYAINGDKYEVIGLINDYEPVIYYHEDNLYELAMHLSFEGNLAYVYSQNKKATINILEEEGLKVKDIYQLNYEEYYEQTFDIFQYIMSLVILGGSLIFLYFIMRSSLISRVYEVGVYRALGVKKANVYRLFTSEIILISIFSSLLGVIASSIFIQQVNKVAGMELFEYPWFISFISIAFLFLCNLGIGIIPVYSLMKLTPSQILSKYDI